MSPIGKRYNRFLVLDTIQMHGTQYLKCLCDCGKIKTVKCSHIKSGATKSCGCYRYEQLKKQKGYLNKNLKPDNYSAKRKLYLAYRNDAKRRNIKFELTMEDFLTFVFKNCSYCNSIPLKTIKTGNRSKINYNGIDRKINNEGYTLENCNSCCTKCNVAKNKYSVHEFLVWVKNIYDFNKERYENK